MNRSEIARQRRRIGLSVPAVGLAVLWQWDLPLAALAAMLVAGAASLSVVLLVPALRRAVESAALGLLATCLLPVPGLLILPFWVLMSGMAYYALYGRWADRGTLRLGLQSHRRALCPLPPPQVWAALIPGESHPDDHWSGRLVDFDHDPDDDQTVYLRFDAGDALPEEQTLTFLHRDAPRACSYLLERDVEGNFEEIRMSFALTMTPDGRTLIATTMSNDALPPRIAFACWFDDTFGDELDSFAATLSARRVWSLRGLPALARFRNKQEAAT